MTAVYYINWMGGTHSKQLMQITSQMWNWSLDRQENSPVCRTPPRCPECGCRSGIMKETGQLRMEARPDDFSMNHANSGPLSGGSFCLQNIGSTSNVHELETRSRSSSDRHIKSVLDEHERLCLSSFCIDGQVPIQDSERESQRVNILIEPVWPTQPWFAVLLSVLFQGPLLLPKLPSLRMNHDNESHPLTHQLNLAMWPISGIPSVIKEFQAKQQPLSYLPGKKPQKMYILLVGEDGNNGVPHLDITLFKRL